MQLARSGHPWFGRSPFPAPGQPTRIRWNRREKPRAAAKGWGGGRAIQSASAAAGEEEPFLLAAAPQANRLFFLLAPSPGYLKVLATARLVKVSSCWRRLVLLSFWLPWDWGFIPIFSTVDQYFGTSSHRTQDFLVDLI